MTNENQELTAVDNAAANLLLTSPMLALAGSIKALPLPVYCQTFLETEGAVKKRLAKGVWVHGVHASVPNGGKRLWINLEAVSKWALENSQEDYI
jgi:hypothetical protein